MAAFGRHPFDRDRLRDCDFPVFLGYGDLTGEHEEIRAAILGRLFGDVRIRRFNGIHHFAPHEQIYTADHVRALRELWAGAASHGKFTRSPGWGRTSPGLAGRPA